LTTLALVTGGNRGLGLSIARGIAARGVHVIIGARRADTGAAAADRLRSEGYAADHVQLDVVDTPSVRAAADHLEHVHGRLDVLVNNAGILPEATAQPTEVVDLALFRRTFETNLFGAVAVTEAVLPLLRRSDRPRVVNVSSTMGSLSDQMDPGSPWFGMVVPAYQASKAALNNVTIALAKRFADTGMVVTSVCPGFVRTGLAPAAQDAPLSADEAAPVAVEAALAPEGTATGRFVSATGPVPW
jgi:NAD(P)-dependent dehydrogenase (short-subunit alcohol dehydrogenase family)